MHSPGSGLMDLSRRSHSTTNHTAHQMRTLPAHHSPAFPEFSRTKPATSTSTLPDTIDLSKHRNVTSSIPLHYTVVCSGPQPSALAPYQAQAHRHHGDIPAIPAHCTYPPNPAPVRHAIPVAGLFTDHPHIIRPNSQTIVILKHLYYTFKFKTILTIIKTIKLLKS